MPREVQVIVEICALRVCLAADLDITANSLAAAEHVLPHSPVGAHMQNFIQSCSLRDCVTV